MPPRVHIPEAEVLSVRFPKKYDHIHLAAKHPKLCTYFIQNQGYVWFFHKLHPYIHTCMPTCTCIDRLMFFPQRYVYMQSIYIYIYLSLYIYKYIYHYIYIHTCVCVLCHFDAFSNSWIHIQEAKVLSVRFPKEYDHIKLAAKHPKLCTYFIQYPVRLWFLHTYINTYIHTCMHTCAFLDSFNFFPKTCIYAINK